MRSHLLAALAVVLIASAATAQTTLPVSDPTDVVAQVMTLTDAQMDQIRGGARGGFSLKGVYDGKLVGYKNPKSCCGPIPVSKARGPKE